MLRPVGQQATRFRKQPKEANGWEPALGCKLCKPREVWTEPHYVRYQPSVGTRTLGYREKAVEVFGPLYVDVLEFQAEPVDVLELQAECPGSGHELRL
jgi:hypothetical protein